MKWPWQRPTSPGSRLAFSLGPQGLAWLLAERQDTQWSVQACGLLSQPADGAAAWPAAMKALSLRSADAVALLDLPAYQLLQIDAPSVPAEELRAAARWRIREMVDGHVDEVTIDVMRVGQPRPASAGNQALFVVAAKTTAVQQLGELARAASWPLRVIDVADTSQRNLQCAAAARLDLGERATACLMRHGALSLLTICVGDELYYSRRLEWDPRLSERARVPVTTRPEPADGLGLAIELDGRPGGDDSPRLLTELQRSFDVWERSWPDLPVAVLMLEAGDDSEVVAEYLQDQLGLRVLPLDLGAGLHLGALSQQATDVRHACTPLLGALLRDDGGQA